MSMRDNDEDDDDDDGGCYESAVAALLSPLHQATSCDAIRASSARRRDTPRDMRLYLRRLGLDLNGDFDDEGDDGEDNDDVEDEDDNEDDEDEDDGNDEDEEDEDDDDEDDASILPPLVFHVAGTKGKGSTLAMCESILRNGLGMNTGLFTSPHLVSIRERIRINGSPISKVAFGRAYWSVRRLLEEEGARNVVDYDYDYDDDDVPVVLPGYFRMLTLMALRVFCCYRGDGDGEGKGEDDDDYDHRPRRIDAILMEVGMGGRYDATNVFEPGYEDEEDRRLPRRRRRRCMAGRSKRLRLRLQRRLLVRGVTIIDYDHVRVLGSTLERIAWEKGGIYVRDKTTNIGPDDGGYDEFVARGGCRRVDGRRRRPKGGEEGKEGEEIGKLSSIVFASGTNTPEVLTVLGNIAESNGSRLSVVRDDDDDDDGGDGSSNSYPTFLGDVGLSGDHQRGNAALALAMCRYAARRRPDLMARRTSSSSSSSSAAAGTTAGTTKTTKELEDDDVRRALATSFWPGRCHTVHLPDATTRDGDDDDDDARGRPSITLRLDGAHTPISMDACVRWFREVTSATATSDRTSSLVRVLVFNCGHERNPIPLLFALSRTKMFDSVYFCTADSERPSAVPKALEDGWAREPLPLLDDVSGRARLDEDHDDDDDGAGSTTTVTWEGMRDSLLATADVDRDNAFHGDVDSAATWQESLGFLWRVMDAYVRRDVGGGGARSPSSVTTGLSVRDALASIRKEAVRWATMIDDDDVGDSVDAERRGLSVEVCVTGSLYIVGSALAAAGWEEGD